MPGSLLSDARRCRGARCRFPGSPDIASGVSFATASAVLAIVGHCGTPRLRNVSILGAAARASDARPVCWSLRSGLKAARTSSREELRLLPGRKVPALVDLVVVDEFGIRPLRPTPRGLILLARKDAHGNRNGDALGVEEAALVFPIETRRRDPGVRQPVKRDVVEDLVTRQFAGGARRPVQGRGDRRGRLAVSVIVVEKPSGQADR